VKEFIASTKEHAGFSPARDVKHAVLQRMDAVEDIAKNMYGKVTFRRR
jgi:hypothetical protein